MSDCNKYYLFYDSFCQVYSVFELKDVGGNTLKPSSKNDAKHDASFHKSKSAKFNFRKLTIGGEAFKILASEKVKHETKNKIK